MSSGASSTVVQLQSYLSFFTFPVRRSYSGDGSPRYFLHAVIKQTRGRNNFPPRSKSFSYLLQIRETAAEMQPLSTMNWQQWDATAVGCGRL